MKDKPCYKPKEVDLFLQLYGLIEHTPHREAI
jgi:hypothetical protein